jgi:hypothetical protein
VRSVGCGNYARVINALPPPPTRCCRYGGGTTGAYLGLARAHGVQHNKRHIAVARLGGDGHSFAFDRPLHAPDANGGGCDRSCQDDKDFSWVSQHISPGCLRYFTIRSPYCADAAVPMPLAQKGLTQATITSDAGQFMRYVYFNLTGVMCEGHKQTCGTLAGPS